MTTMEKTLNTFKEALAEVAKKNKCQQVTELSFKEKIIEETSVIDIESNERIVGTIQFGEECISAQVVEFEKNIILSSGISMTPFEASWGAINLISVFEIMFTNPEMFQSLKERHQ